MYEYAKAFMVIDQVLELLSDGEWHNLNEVASILGVSGVKVGLIASFLNKYGFIDLKLGIKAKLTEPTHQFLKWIKRVEKEGMR